MKRRITALLLLMVLLLLPGCKKEEKTKELTVEEVTVLVKDLVYPSSDGTGATAEERLLQGIRAKTKCILQQYENGVVTIDLTVPDMKPLFLELMTQETDSADPWSAYNQAVDNLLMKMDQPNCPTISQTFSIKVDFSGAQPRLIANKELTNVLMGNMLSYFEELTAEMEAEK